MINDDAISGFVDDSQYRQPVEQLIDQYTMRQEIDSHGFNRLVKACRGGKWYMLKCLKPEYSLPLFEMLLTKEYELLRSLDHPNIVRCVDIQMVEGLGRCIVTEFIAGRSLRVVMREESTRHNTELLKRIAHELAVAMKYMHSLQIVHRDLKPENILITDNGNNVKIIDFGLSDSDLYAILKQPAGTANYIAPEQTNGATTDVRADIYSFGVVLKEMFANRHDLTARRYQKVAGRCMKPIEKRVQNADELLQLLAKAEDNRPWWQSHVARYTLLAVLLLSVALVMYKPNSVPMLEGTNIPLSEIDSLTVGYTQPQRIALMTALQRFTADRPAIQRRIEKTMDERARFVSDFTPDSIVRISMDDASTTNPNGFVIRLRNEMQMLGDVIQIPPPVRFRPETDQEEFRAFCIITARTIGFGYRHKCSQNDKMLPPSPFRARLLSVYYPDRYVPIIQEHEAQMILETLLPDAQQRLKYMDYDDRAEAVNAALVKVHHTSMVFSSWSLIEFGYFLTHYFPHTVE